MTAYRPGPEGEASANDTFDSVAAEAARGITEIEAFLAETSLATA